MRWFLLLLAAWTAHAQAVHIRGATVVDGTGAPARKAEVLIRADRIEAVGESLSSPPGATVIQADGLTLIPGFFDLHTHLPYSAVSGAASDHGKNLKAYLVSGVTSVADFGVYAEMFEPVRRLVRDGVFIAPRLHLAARLTTPGGHGAEGGRSDFFSLEVLTPREARAAMAFLRPYKPDVIKVFTDGWRYGAGMDMTSMDESTLRAITEEARKDNLKVLTHTVTLEKAKIAARAGVNVLAHGIGNAIADDELIALLRHNRVTYAPTMTVYEPASRRPDPPLFLFDPAARAILRRPRAPTPSLTTRQKRWEILLANVSTLRAAGIPFGTGTDAGVTGTHHGVSTLREMELLVEGGLTPLEAITAATSASARALGLEKERGTIAPGMAADVVLIKGAPHERISDIRNTARVFLAGREIEREALLRDLGSEALTPIPAVKTPHRIDDFQSPDGRTRLGTLRLNQTDSGHDKTKMLFHRVARTGGNFAIAVHAKFGEKDRPFARLVLPLTKGPVEPADLSPYRGVLFQARGAGEYRLIAERRSREQRAPFARFRAGPLWRSVRVPFSAFMLASEKAPENWDRSDLLSLSFELSGKPGEYGWLEIDNVMLFR
jgi:imidazolonepropionase-like amidohydrolase